MHYDFDRLVERRGTSSLKWDSSPAPSGRPGLLPLWVADMDFLAPPEIQDAIRRRVEHGIYGYSREPDSYYEAYQGWLVKRHGWKVEREWLLDSPGVVPALSACIASLTSPGDGVVIQPPVYYPFAGRIRASGRRVIENPLRLEGSRWSMDSDGLEAALDQGARMLVLCSPHNPVGRVWSPEELAGLVTRCARRGVVIVSDEIHHDLVLPGFRHVPVASLSEEAARTSITLTAATKSFNLAGLGGSMTVIPDAALRRRVDAFQRSLFAGLGNAIATVAAEAAWRDGEKWLDEMLHYVEGNYRFLGEELARRFPAVTLLPLEGTYLPLLDLRRLGLDDEQARARLLQAGLWLDEGSMFGSGGEGFQRINLACPRATIREAAERLVRALG